MSNGSDMMVNYSECFQIFMDQNNMLSVGVFDKALQSLQLAFSQAEFEQIKNNLASQKITQLSFERFVETVESLKKPIDVQEELEDALSVYDHNNEGMISISELRNVLTTIGETLKKEEFDRLLKGIETDSEGKAKIKDLIKVLTSR